MKHIYIFIFFIIFGKVNAQNIVIENITDNKSTVSISTGKEVNIKFDNYFRAETDKSFGLVNYKIHSENSGNNLIGKYNKRKIKFDDGNKYFFKFDKKNSKVFLLDNNKKQVFEGEMIFDDNNILKEIEVVKNDLNSEIVESWLALATIERLYGIERKMLLSSVIEGAAFGFFAGLVF